MKAAPMYVFTAKEGACPVCGRAALVFVTEGIGFACAATCYTGPEPDDAVLLTALPKPKVDTHKPEAVHRSPASGKGVAP